MWNKEKPQVLKKSEIEIPSNRWEEALEDVNNEAQNYAKSWVFLIWMWQLIQNLFWFAKVLMNFNEKADKKYVNWLPTILT